MHCQNPGEEPGNLLLMSCGSAQKWRSFLKFSENLDNIFRTEDNFQQNVIEVHVILLRKRRKDDPIEVKGSPRKRRDMPSALFSKDVPGRTVKKCLPAKGKLATARKLSLR